MIKAGASTFAPHDCFSWNVEHWTNQGTEATYTFCATCGRITHFRWKGFIKHLQEYFK